jgi:hypothetical protein
MGLHKGASNIHTDDIFGYLHTSQASAHQTNKNTTIANLVAPTRTLLLSLSPSNLTLSSTAGLLFPLQPMDGHVPGAALVTLACSLKPPLSDVRWFHSYVPSDARSSPPLSEGHLGRSRRGIKACFCLPHVSGMYAVYTKIDAVPVPAPNPSCSPRRPPRPVSELKLPSVIFIGPWEPFWSGCSSSEELSARGNERAFHVR